MPRLTKIYTKTGDDGTTALGGGGRVRKDSLRVETFGTVDELNSILGAAVACDLEPGLTGEVKRIQNELFNLGADLCTPEAQKAQKPGPRIEERHVLALEAAIDRMNDVLGPLQNFILPGGAPGAAQLHMARAVCRRAERLAVTLSGKEPVGSFVLVYLNRLSDALFVMARWENRHRGVADVTWDSRM